MSGAGLPGTYVEGFHDRDAVEKMTYRPLGGTGHSVSVLGLGASALGGVFHDTTEEECCLVVHAALKAGVNVIDTAPWYGQGKSESMLGLALKGVPRQAYLLNTKVGRYEQAVDEMFDFSAARVTRSVDESLHRMGVDYIDTIQVHDVEFAPSLDVIVEQTLPALDALRRSGKVRMIGITGYALAPLREVLERSAVKIDAVLSYCRLTLIDASLEEHLDFFAARGVGLYNAAPTGMGLLTPQGPPAWHPASDEDKELCRELRELCVTQGADVARLALRAALCDARLPCTFISCARTAQMASNLRCAAEELSPAEEAALAALRAKAGARRVQWEGVEVGRYWEELGKKLQMERLYTRR